MPLSEDASINKLGGELIEQLHAGFGKHAGFRASRSCTHFIPVYFITFSILALPSYIEASNKTNDLSTQSALLIQSCIAYKLLPSGMIFESVICKVRLD